LRDHGHIRRGWLGVRIQAVTQDIADSLGLDKARGALVSSVTPDGPAAKAGLLPGDVILTFDGKEVPEMRRLPLMVAETDADKMVPVVVFRKGEKTNLQIKIGELSAKEEADDQKPEPKEAEQPAPNAEKVDELGINAAPLTDTLRTRYDIKKDVSGVIVTNVSSDGIAADQGIDVGDVISQAAQQDIKTPKDLVEQIKQAKKGSKPLLLLVNRKDDLRYVAITFGKKK
jgi:serine protease Do